MKTLSDAATELNWKPFRLRQVQHAREIELKTSWGDLTNLSKDDRAFLERQVPFDTIETLKKDVADDNTAVKFLLRAADGASFETVLLLHRGEKKNWGTVCVSSQVGCPVGCTFCATGQMKLERNLSTEEILDQFILAKREAKKRGFTGQLNVVFMGMGEPLLNLPAVLPAIQTLVDPDRHGLAPSRVTVSTSGIVSGLQELRAANLGIGLALSLHAPNDTLRTRLMPINETFPLTDILDELKKWENAGTEVLFEYVLIDGVNDAKEHAEELARLLTKHHGKINLIPLNPIPDSDLARSQPEKMRAFLGILEQARLHVTLRHTKGDKIAAACGQLKTRSKQ